MAGIMERAADKTSGNPRAGVHGQFVSRKPLQARIQRVVKKDALDVTAPAPHVIHPIPISSERAILHERAGVLKNRQDAAIDKRPLARALRHHALDTLPTNKQLRTQAALPARRSIAAPVTCVRFLRNTQFSIKTDC